MMILIRIFKAIKNCKDFVTIRFLNNSYCLASIVKVFGWRSQAVLFFGLVRQGYNNLKNNMLINIISYTFLGIIFYIFYWYLKIFDAFQIIIFSIISFSIFMFISDNFKLSNNKFIKILQKLIFSSSILALIGLILNLFDVSMLNCLPEAGQIFCDNDSDSENEVAQQNKVNKEEINKNGEESLQNKEVVQVTSNIDDKNDEYYNFKVRKEIIDKATDKVKDLCEVGVKEIAPNLGVGAAVGKVTAEAFKHTAGMAPLPRVAIVGGTALTTAAATVIGIELGKVVVKNAKALNEIEASKLEVAGVQQAKDESGRNSPSDFDSGFISSVLEGNEIPLITMVNGLCYLNYAEFSLILALFSLLFRKYLNRFLKRFILNLYNKYIVVGASRRLQQNDTNNKEENINASFFRLANTSHNSSSSSSSEATTTTSSSEATTSSFATTNKSFNILDKYTNYLIVFIFICLFWIKFLNIYFSNNLVENIDSYVKVYNHIKDNSFAFLIFSLKYENNFSNNKKKHKNIIYNIPTHLIKLHRKYSTNSLVTQVASNMLKHVKIPFPNYRNISNCCCLQANVQLANKDKPKFPIAQQSISYELSSPIFKELFSILNNSILNQETQLKIEYFLKSQALELTKLNISSTKVDTGVVNSIIQSSHISHLLIHLLIDKKKSLEKLIENYKTNLILIDPNLSSLNSKIMYNINKNFLVNIIYGRTLSIISNNKLLNNRTYVVETTIDLGKEIINRYMLDCYKKEKITNSNLSLVLWKKNNQDLIIQTEDTHFRFELGNVLINFMMDLKLIKIEVKILAKDEKKSIFVAGPVLINLIPTLKNSFNIQVLPNKIPMVVPPKSYKWKDNDYLELGGYLLNGVEYTDKIILSNWELSSETKLLNKNDICDMVNKINSVAFSINENVLDFIFLHNEKYKFFTNPNFVHPLTLKAKENKLTLKEEKELESFNSKKNLELNILGLATIFKNVPAFYMPVRLDYRGRMYCVTEYLNYQGVELAKALLKFSIGEKIYLNNSTAMNYLKIFGANCFGNKLEKKSFKERISWIDNNLTDIIHFENGVLLNLAENKMLFLSFCFEFKNYIQALNLNQEYFYSNLPIQLDATCNGFQHLTLLIDDLALSKQLNLTDSTCEDIPNDFYTFVALKIQNYFSNKLEEYNSGKLSISDENKESYRKIASLAIHRSLIKKAVMTIPYNASASSIVNYIKDNFDKQINPNYDKVKNKDFFIYIYKNNHNIKFNEIDFLNLRKALDIVIYIDYPKLSALVKYLKDIANIANKLNIPIPWILPTGLEIKQQYYSKETLKVKPFTYTKNLVNITVLNKKKFNKNKQKIALMPNLVHSLDAASLCLVIVNYFKQIENINFYSIHDCFAVPCNKVYILIELLKTAYCIIYSNSKYLLEFDANFRYSIIKSYGEEAVSFNDSEGKIKINFKNDFIELKYPSINSILNTKISQIKLNNSKYIIH